MKSNWKFGINCEKKGDGPHWTNLKEEQMTLSKFISKLAS